MSVCIWGHTLTHLKRYIISLVTICTSQSLRGSYPCEPSHAFIWEYFCVSLWKHLNLCSRTGRQIFQKPSQRRNKKRIIWAYCRADSQIHPSILESWWDQSEKWFKLECGRNDRTAWGGPIQTFFSYFMAILCYSLMWLLKGLKKNPTQSFSNKSLSTAAIVSNLSGVFEVRIKIFSISTVNYRPL